MSATLFCIVEKLMRAAAHKFNSIFSSAPVNVDGAPRHGNILVCAIFKWSNRQPLSLTRFILDWRKLSNIKYSFQTSTNKMQPQISIPFAMVLCHCVYFNLPFSWLLATPVGFLPLLVAAVFPVIERYVYICPRNITGPVHSHTFLLLFFIYFCFGRRFFPHPLLVIRKTSVDVIAHLTDTTDSECKRSTHAHTHTPKHAAVKR